ncbi:cell wall hydrolase [Altericroceibacterium endophyticum]|nr:cell wall hydrolase [Altericroceibacterium endophyticum]
MAQNSQDDAAQLTEAVATDITDADDAAGPRFVANPVVQALPEKADSEIAPVEASSLVDLVATLPTDGALSREMRCLAGAVYFEARGEPLSGQLAVARVIVNRTESNRFPDDYCSVVTQRSQFSFVRNGRIPQPRLQSAAWRRAKAIATIAHQEMWDSQAQDALYFHATYVRPRWARNKIARATIDRHIFYR